MLSARVADMTGIELGEAEIRYWDQPIVLEEPLTATVDFTGSATGTMVITTEEVLETTVPPGRPR